MPSKPDKGHQRICDDSHDTIGSNMNVTLSHVKEMNKTKKQQNMLETRLGHHRSLNKIMTFWEEYYPDYFAAGTRFISEDEINNEMLFYYPNQKAYMKRDMVYQGLNVDFVLAFFAATKKKDDGSNNIYSYVHFRKYNDAILFGARTLGHNLPSIYFTEIDKFLNSYRKEVQSAKKRGQSDK